MLFDHYFQSCPALIQLSLRPLPFLDYYVKQIRVFLVNLLLIRISLKFGERKEYLKAPKSTIGEMIPPTILKKKS